MTELDIKDLILKRMSDLMPNATSLDMSYMAGTLKTLEAIGKPDPSEKYFNSLTDAFKVMNDKRYEDSEALKKVVEGFNNQKEEKEDERV